MSIALESGGGNRIERHGFIHGVAWVSVCDSPDPGIFLGDRGLPAVMKVEQLREEDLDSCSSSSIGRNSDASGGSLESGGDGGEIEVQSSYKGPLDTMDSLEEVLPIKKGISKFYNGKSKSFTSLADASSASSVKDLAKPENVYSRKRKNSLTYNNFWDKNCSCLQRSTGGGISKKSVNSSRSTLSPALTSGNAESNNNSENSNSKSMLPSQRLPPLHPNGKTSPSSGSPSPPRRNSSTGWRSYSLSDLQCVDAGGPARAGD